MKQTMLRANLLRLLVVTTAFTGSMLTACSAPHRSMVSQNQPAPATSASSGSMMDHSQMDHGMDLGPADAEYDLRFIDAMIPHHQGAIAMANEALQKSQRPEIKALAEAIIKAQDREINDLMRKWRKAWYPNVSDDPVAWHAQMGHSMTMSSEQRQSMMMSMDLGAADAQFDLRFLNAMIPHHEGAIVMARDALSKSQRPEIKQLANNIITSQQAEIDQMQQWRKSWYNQ
jgi:uncharacterized protein (DUF305 family)